MVDGTGVVVHVDKMTGKSTELSNEVYQKISAYEKDVKIIKDK